MRADCLDRFPEPAPGPQEPGERERDDSDVDVDKGDSTPDPDRCDERQGRGKVTTADYESYLGANHKPCPKCGGDPCHGEPPTL